MPESDGNGRHDEKYTTSIHKYSKGTHEYFCLDLRRESQTKKGKTIRHDWASTHGSLHAAARTETSSEKKTNWSGNSSKYDHKASTSSTFVECGGPSPCGQEGHARGRIPKQDCVAWGMTGGGRAPTRPSATTRLHLSLHIYNHTHLPMPALLHLSLHHRSHTNKYMGVPPAATPHAHAPTSRPY